MAEQVAVVEPRAAAQDPHLLAQLRLDERVDHDRGTPLRPLAREPQVVHGLYPWMANLLELLVGELRLERVHEARRGLTCGVRNDVELDRRLRHAAEASGESARSPRARRACRGRRGGAGAGSRVR